MSTHHMYRQKLITNSTYSTTTCGLLVDNISFDRP